jgi:hypothetical protein
MIFALSMMTSTLASGQAAPTPLQPNAIPGVPPRLIQFANSLNDASGNPLTDRAAVTFSIYADQTGGVPLWQETQNIQFSQGHYSVFLGDSTPGGIPTELFASGQSRWLGVRAVLPGEQEQPRILLASVPYALKAADADSLGGLPASAYLRVENPAFSAIQSSKRAVASPPQTPVTTNGGTSNTVPLFTGTATIGNSVVTQSGSNVGINMSSPTQSLDIGGIFHVSGLASPTTASQGAYLGWNALVTGETDFINNEGLGTGGFVFMNTPQSGSPRSTLISISGGGNVAVNGNVAATGALTAGSINAVVVVQNTQSDIGAQIKTALGSLPGGCGEVYIAAGTYTQGTTIVMPRCVKLRGASARGTILNYTPT